MNDLLLWFISHFRSLLPEEKKYTVSHFGILDVCNSTDQTWMVSKHKICSEHKPKQSRNFFGEIFQRKTTKRKYQLKFEKRENDGPKSPEKKLIFTLRCGDLRLILT